MAEASVQARIVLCILHDSPGAIREVCGEFTGFQYDQEYSGQGRDDRMTESFVVSEETVWPSLADSDWSAVAGHRDVAYVLSPRLDAETALAKAQRALEFVARCFEVGARAIKCESSGLTHGRERWCELAARGDDASLYRAWVRRPLGDDRGIYSCGMHLLGIPDIQVAGNQATQALKLIDGFAMYLLIDGAGGRLRTGHTFSLSDDDPSWRLSTSACSRYEDDDFFFNPHGYWQLEAI